MSDQSSAPQKPKPGSLRDRIAAFEKSATAGAAPVNAPPPPRPKPAGFATWKPKQTSPPSSPPATQTEHVQGSSSGMSAYDARESITKGASLKERMAALQNKGAFGAPPPVGLKPVVERPKWKPPPVVQTDEADSPSEGTPSIDKSISPPQAVTHEQTAGNSIQNESDFTHGTTAERSNEDAESTQDPEEDERQRRAAIAARMARLGGARVGMAPPIVAKKPLVRRPTQEEQPMAVEDTNPADVPPYSQPSASTEEAKRSSNEPNVSSEQENQKPGSTSSRKSSLNITTEVVSGHSPKIPTSMPVPAGPRRVGPPRKKPLAKATAPPSDPPKDEPATTGPDLGTVESTPHEDPESTLGIHIIPTSKDMSSMEEDGASALAEDSEEPSILHDNSEALEKSRKSVEATSPPPLPAVRSLVFQQTGSLAHTLEHSIAIETADEGILPSPSSTQPLRGDVDISEPASEKEEVGGDKNFIPEHLGRTPSLESQPGLTSKSVSVLDDMHFESSMSLQEDSLHEAGNDQNDDYKLNKTSDQSRSAPLTPANRPSISSTEFEAFESIDTPQLSGDNSAPLKRRSVPPPRRVVPAAPEGDQELVEEPESDEEANESLTRSHLFIPPPKERRADQQKKNLQDEDDGADDGSENDIPPLPVPHRQSMDMRVSRSLRALQSDSDPDTDHDGQPLPVPPRPTTRPIPPPRAQESSQNEDEEPSNVSISISTPFPLDREVMDEDEGDPIDPVHIPSRRSSYHSPLHSSSPPTQTGPPSHSPPPLPGSRPQNTLQAVQYMPSPPGSQPKEAGRELEENAEEMRKRSIAERMAKLGGIKFGAAPIPRSTSSAFQESELVDGASTVEDKPDEPNVSNEEEEERARKERIAAKLASMGGMRIGMMPLGAGNVLSKGSQSQEKIAPSSPPNSVAPARPFRLAPQPPDQTPGASDPVTLSPVTSDDGVQVEAEESEAEEVNYQDVEPEEAPPIPPRSGRPTRRQSSGDTTASPPPRRPPVPATPTRRMSAQVPSPQATSPQRKDSSHAQYDYVMVDQIESQETLPTRRTSVASPLSKTAESQGNISSQWELPSIPTPDLDFGSKADLSLSWTDAGESLPPSSQPAQSASLRGKPRRQPTTDKSISVDDLIAMWGRVGVQVCEVATALFEKSKKTLIGDGTYAGFVKAVLADVPNAAQVSIDTGEYGYLVYSQNGSVVQKRASEIMPGDIVEVHDARFKGHRGLQTYQLTVGGSGELVVGIVAEFDNKKSKLKVFQANQHVGQQTVESVGYRLEDLKSGTIKIYRVLEA